MKKMWKYHFNAFEYFNLGNSSSSGNFKDHRHIQPFTISFPNSTIFRITLSAAPEVIAERQKS